MKAKALAVTLALLGSPAMAQQTVEIPSGLATEMVAYLRNGGTYFQAASISDRLILAMQAQQQRDAKRDVTPPLAQPSAAGEPKP